MGDDAPHAQQIRAIDTDVHYALENWAELRPYLSQPWKWLVDEKKGFFGMSHRGYQNIGGWPNDGALRGDATPPNGIIGSDPGFTRKQLIETEGVDYAILNGGPTALSITYNPDIATALASAHNDWLVDKWLRPYKEYRGSIIIAPQDPIQAAAEIDRVGSDRHFAQIAVYAGSQAPYGYRQYYPIYEAAQNNKLPIAVHFGGTASGIGQVAGAAGHPTTYVEYHTDQSQIFQAHLVSLVTEGIFEKFPELMIVFVEGGVCWLPHVMWRLDKNWKGLRAEVPWLKRPPSEYILEHVRFTTQPLEEPKRFEHLLQIFEMIDAGRTVMYSSDYPHWDFDPPRMLAGRLPEPLRSRIMFETARELYRL
jgi:predicted TIM-barrel fold metal-dependent hydrolase